MINYSFKAKVASWYCLIFYGLMCYKLLNGLLLFQLQPSFIYVRQDMFTWLFMQTGLHQWLLNNQAGCVMADILFYSTPLVFVLVLKYKENWSSAPAFCMLVINWCYIQCYTLYASTSIEGYLPWLLFPLLFIVQSVSLFSLLFDGLRYVFLYLFSSAAIWKLIKGSVLNIQQMSGVLLYQHGQQLTNSPGYWQSRMYMWLINHEGVSYVLYLAGFLIELIFIIGFFTKKYDRLLAAAFISFLLMDHLIMRIPYYELSPMLLTLLLKNEKADRPA